jgi:hypothetical protein
MPPPTLLQKASSLKMENKVSLYTSESKEEKLDVPVVSVQPAVNPETDFKELI